MRALVVRGIGVCASGLPDWEHASHVLADPGAFFPGPVSKGVPDGLPPTERRRMNETSRLAGLAAADALANRPPGGIMTIPAIFISSDGDGAVLAQMVHSLSQREIVVSPTVFHNSVYNAPAGYWSIATRSTAPSTTICADAASIAAGLMEAYAQAYGTAGPVLVVAVDAPFPESIRALSTSAAPFACALLVEPDHGQKGPRFERWRITDDLAPDDNGASEPVACAFAGNAMAAALPLLRALARGGHARVMLPYQEGTRLELAVVTQ
jgi:hypothetical protein